MNKNAIMNKVLHKARTKSAKWHIRSALVDENDHNIVRYCKILARVWQKTVFFLKYTKGLFSLLKELVLYELVPNELSCEIF